jgi:hypothetical protein
MPSRQRIGSFQSLGTCFLLLNGGETGLWNREGGEREELQDTPSETLATNPLTAASETDTTTLRAVPPLHRAYGF